MTYSIYFGGALLAFTVGVNGCTSITPTFGGSGGLLENLAVAVNGVTTTYYNCEIRTA